MREHILGVLDLFGGSITIDLGVDEDGHRVDPPDINLNEHKWLGEPRVSAVPPTLGNDSGRNDVSPTGVAGEFHIIDRGE